MYVTFQDVSARTGLESSQDLNVTGVRGQNNNSGIGIFLLNPLDGLDAVGWDPHFAPDTPKEPTDVVNLGFVINVIEDSDE